MSEHIREANSEDRRCVIRRQSDVALCHRGHRPEECSITQEELQFIIDKAAEKAAEKALGLGKAEIITTVGSFVVTKAAYAIGAIALGLVYLLAKTGIIEWKL